MQQESADQGSALRGRFLSWLAAGRIVHALMLAQPNAEERVKMLEFMAHALLCQGASKPCGACSACALTRAGSHPDDLVFSGDKGGVDDVRALIVELGARRWMGGWRPVRIPFAEKLTPQAQNALLKTLEEPPEGTVFLLGVDQAGKLLPTVRSRCVPLSEDGFRPVPEQDMQAARRLISSDAGTRIAAVREVASPGALDALEQMLWRALREREAGNILDASEVVPETRRFTIPQLLDMIRSVGVARRRVLRRVGWAMALEGLIIKAGETSS